MKTTLLSSFLLINALCIGQSFKFRQFAEQDGLNNKFVYSIEQDDLGFLLIGTGEGLYRYDGFQFTQYTTDEGLSDDFITCSSKDQQGQVWFGHGNGAITKYNQGKLQKIDVSALTTSRINQIYEDHEQKIWVVTQNDGLLLRTDDTTWTKYEEGIEEFTLYSFCRDRENRLWLGTDMGLLNGKLQENIITYDYVEDIMETKVSALLLENQVLTAGTEDAGIFNIALRKGGFDVQPLLYDTLDFKGFIVNSLLKDDDNNLWISTNNRGLIQLSIPTENGYVSKVEYSQDDQQYRNSIRVTFRDREHNIWIGSIGAGLLKLEDDYFSVFTDRSENPDKTIHSIHEKNDTIWYGSAGRIVKAYEHPDNIIGTYDAAHGLPPTEIKAIYCDPTNTLWIGSATDGLFRWNYKKNKFEYVKLGEDNLSQKVNDIIGYKDLIFVATDFGVYQVNNGIVVSHLTIQSGLTHNVVKSLFSDMHGRIWIGTHDNQVTFIEDGIIKTIETPFSGLMLETKCITEDNNGNIWIGTEGTGVFMVSDTVAVHYDKRNGLYSDYCYSITCDNRNKLWIGHRGALSQVNLMTGKIEVIDPSPGFEYEFRDNSVAKFPNGILLFGTNKGVLRYEPEKDRRNEIEPVIHFESVTISDSIYNVSDIFRLPYGQYKLELDFIGISHRNPQAVTYQYFLEGYDTDWSDPTTESFADYNKLGPGEYTFKVRAFNADGGGGELVRECRFIIDTPFWQKWWFIVACGITLIVLVRYIIVRRERILKKNQEYLQRALNEATHEVMQQKELLEVKNKDITDSIHYAKNIQKAMLPNYDSLTNYFSDAFVYFKPRDIVSGDFYWVEKFENDIVVSCADCTGHGVPGAFMSLIGTTLLKEVARDKKVQCARDVLVRLDDSLRQLLNKRGAEFGVEDGMDISVFNYNFKTKKVMISSANRPVVLRIGGEWIEIKGDRQSVGGSDITLRKDFLQHEFSVNDGDQIYMFSDGITDQFGGSEGKKLKRSGLIKQIQDVAHLPMKEQRVRIREEFYSWKGDHAQIDDIIIMGIRF